VSATVHTAFVDGLPATAPGHSRAGEEAPSRPLLRLMTFAALAAYGLVRWGELITPTPGWRVFGLLALSVAMAGAGPRVHRLSGSAAVVLTIVAVIATFPIAGIPLSWVRHVRIAATADGIGQGLSALPGVLVPYAGPNAWVRVVVMLGAAVLLLDSALILTFASSERGELRRAAAALPLIALAIVPATLVKPKSPYLQGLLLFGLLVAFMWGERLRRPSNANALGVAALAGAVAMVLSPALDTHQAWFNYRAWAGSFAIGKVDSFNWTQTYGPLRWPRAGHAVLEVSARTADYWKAENLETFNGTAWTGASLPAAAGLPPPSDASLARWTQALRVTIRGMRTFDVIGAGETSYPAHIPGSALKGSSAGTWTAGELLGPGASYQVSAYSPHPSPTELSLVGAYPVERLQGYLTIGLPRKPFVLGPASQVEFPFFHSGLPIQSIAGAAGNDGAAAMSSSPYARAYALARRLAARARTPYQFVVSVQGFLAHGFSYDEHPPIRRYPLESFLFADRRGYCQQFSGAMALLLRMGGVPARVAAGFTSGAYDRATHRWVVSDRDAHAWVEAWFPRYGWVRFDPTPAVAPARGGTGGASSQLPRKDLKNTGRSSQAVTHPVTARDKAARTPRSATRGGGYPVMLVLAAAAIALLIAALIYQLLRLRPEPTDDELVHELERALARSGRPVVGGVTLAGLERRFRSSPAAAAYIRQVRLARFAGSAAPPSESERRALRAQLGAGRGALGRIRALWALPPRLKGGGTR
jgi:hypothetical protein